MKSDERPRLHEGWAHLRFSVVGPLLASPPRAGELRARLEELAGREWVHPTTGEPVRFAVSTIERWYYQARSEPRNPVEILRRRVRSDAGTHPGISKMLKQVIVQQHGDHKRWSYKLHVDNLVVRVKDDPELGPMPSYSTVRRFMKSQGLLRVRRPRKERSEDERARTSREGREIRSYEAPYVGSLWHLDYHHGSRRVPCADGRWVTPVVLGVVDDYSRVACHVQWYLSETAENLVHGLCQAFQKRGLPRALQTDNGSPMIAAETVAGLIRLSVVHKRTLPYAAYQNGKQESFWGQLEGRLMAMLEGCEELTLPQLNEATQAWVELEYNARLHGETGETPRQRFVRGKDVLRPCPTPDELRQAFMTEALRTQRRSDGTVSLEGVRFEIPDRYRHLDRICLRYASWDLGCVLMADPRTGGVLSRLFPLDKTRNADGRRRRRGPSTEVTSPPPSGMAPLMKELMARYAATGLPPAYLKKEENDS